MSSRPDSPPTPGSHYSDEIPDQETQDAYLRRGEEYLASLRKVSPNTWTENQRRGAEYLASFKTLPKEELAAIHRRGEANLARMMKKAFPRGTPCERHDPMIGNLRWSSGRDIIEEFFPDYEPPKEKTAEEQDREDEAAWGHTVSTPGDGRSPEPEWRLPNLLDQEIEGMPGDGNEDMEISKDGLSSNGLDRSKLEADAESSAQKSRRTAASEVEVSDGMEVDLVTASSAMTSATIMMSAGHGDQPKISDGEHVFEHVPSTTIRSILAPTSLSTPPIEIQELGHSTMEPQRKSDVSKVSAISLESRTGRVAIASIETAKPINSNHSVDTFVASSTPTQTLSEHFIPPKDQGKQPRKAELPLGSRVADTQVSKAFSAKAPSSHVDDSSTSMSEATPLILASVTAPHFKTLDPEPGNIDSFSHETETLLERQLLTEQEHSPRSQSRSASIDVQIGKKGEDAVAPLVGLTRPENKAEGENQTSTPSSNKLGQAMPIQFSNNFRQKLVDDAVEAGADVYQQTAMLEALHGVEKQVSLSELAKGVDAVEVEPSILNNPPFEPTLSRPKRRSGVSLAKEPAKKARSSIVALTNEQHIAGGWQPQSKSYWSQQKRPQIVDFLRTSTELKAYANAYKKDEMINKIMAWQESMIAQKRSMSYLPPASSNEQHLPTFDPKPKNYWISLKPAYVKEYIGTVRALQQYKSATKAVMVNQIMVWQDEMAQLKGRVELGDDSDTTATAAMDDSVPDGCRDEADVEMEDAKPEHPLPVSLSALSKRCSRHSTVVGGTRVESALTPRTPVHTPAHTPVTLPFVRTSANAKDANERNVVYEPGAAPRDSPLTTKLREARGSSVANPETEEPYSVVTRTTKVSLTGNKAETPLSKQATSQVDLESSPSSGLSAAPRTASRALPRTRKSSDASTRTNDRTLSKVSDKASVGEGEQDGAPRSRECSVTAPEAVVGRIGKTSKRREKSGGAKAGLSSRRSSRAKTGEN